MFILLSFALSAISIGITFVFFRFPEDKKVLVGYKVEIAFSHFPWDGSNHVMLQLYDIFLR
jgi:hypothetical protein